MKCQGCTDEVEKIISGQCPRCYGRAAKRRERSRPGAKERRRVHDRKMYVAKKEELSAYKSLRVRRLKARVFELLGKKCSWWEGCTWTDIRALQIDHVQDDGNLDRQMNGKDQAALYLRILRCERPAEKYQVLCANHNWVKRCENEKVSGCGSAW